MGSACARHRAPPRYTQKMRLRADPYVRTVWLDVAKIALKKQQRESEEQDAEVAIAEHEEDRS